MSEGTTKRGRGRPVDQRRRHMIAMLRRRGLTQEEIGKRLGVSHQAVYDALNRMGFPHDPRLDGRKRARPPMLYKPPLVVKKILAWADAYFAKHGRWPSAGSGPIPDSGGETWQTVNAALYGGGRGLPGGSSLSRLLAEKRGARPKAQARVLSEGLILEWAQRHHERTGDWPRHDSGPIPGVPGETWGAVNQALGKGTRGLTGGSSLEKLLRKHGRIS